MLNYRRIFSFIVILFIIFSPQTYAEDSDVNNSIIYPCPQPFSIDARSAIYCINILRNSRYLEKTDDSAKYKIVEVETVWSWFLKYDESFPEGYRKRYDIIVNGIAIDWDNSFIEYGGKMINMKLLFLYRNQNPPAGLGHYLSE